MVKRRRIVSLVTALCLTVTGIPMSASAAEPGNTTPEGYSYLDGYDLKWSDEFSGDTLNRDDWNVELHDPGWVNSELQAYVDSEENIQVKDGMLYINPVKKVTVINQVPSMLTNADFANGMEGWVETIANWGGADGSADAAHAIENGSIAYTINNAGNADWNVQLKQQNLNLAAGKKYIVSYDVTSTIDRQIKSGVMSTGYVWYGGSDPVLKADEKTNIRFEFTMEADDEAADFYISLGLPGADTEALDPHTVTISNLSFVAEGGDDAATKPVTKTTYTSGRISTQNKQTFTYGLFEARVKVPEGMGYLPAFWLMANDENVYGQWPRCGEIDCMEVMGQDTKKAYGTIHYGNPHSESQGTAVLGEDDASYSEEFHTFACEWEPGKITWYMDGVKFHEESDWHSTTEGQGTLTYPAPFDQPFYVILNLAIGGSWVGYPDENTSFENNPYVIDYVRVYQKDSYDEDVKKPDKDVVLRDPDETGNYINNGNFAEAEDLTDDVNWKFLTALGGEAEAKIADKTMTITTTNEGTVDYSVQLVQAGLPFEKGGIYEVSFEASAAEERTMRVDVKAPDYGYKSYMPTKVAALTTEKTTYTYEFEMKDESDANGRLEFNMGAAGNTAEIKISNVTVKKVADPDYDKTEDKGVLANGSYIYNGRFQEGTNHLGYWDVTKGGATAYVTPFNDGRRLKVTVPEGSKAPFVLSQKDLAFKEGQPYQISFTAQTDTEGMVVDVAVGGKNHTVELEAGVNKEYTFKIPATAKFANHDVSFTISTPGTVYLDNISMTEAALIKNGSFNDGTTGYEVYVDSSASASYVVDSLSEDNALDVTVNKTSDADWKIQIKQNNVKLEEGKTYTLKFDAKSSMPRDIRVIMQGGEAKSWPVYSNDNIVSLTGEYRTFEDTFTMTAATDPEAFLSICLGAVNGVEIDDQHRVVIDNISLTEVGGAGGEDGALEVVGEIADLVYTGAALKPAVKVYDGDGLLTLGKDYTVTYANNVNANSVRKVNDGMGENFNEALPYATITGKGNYTGTVKVNFNINHREIGNADANALADVTLSVNDQLLVNKARAQAVFKSLKVGKVTLKATKDFDITLTALSVKDAKGEAVEAGTEMANASVPAGYTGSFTLIVSGKGNYTGEIKKVVYVNEKPMLLKNATVTLGKNCKTRTYTGKEITLTPAYYDAATKKCYAVADGEITETEVKAEDVFIVKEGKECLVYGKDYEVSFSGNRAVGTATMTIRGIGAYQGEKTVSFKITGKTFSAGNVTVTGMKDLTYTGNALTQSDLRLSYKLDKNTTKPLRAGSDYMVQYKNNVNKGTVTVTFTGKPSAGYTGKFTKTFKINAQNIADETVITRDEYMNYIVADFDKKGAKANTWVRLKDANGNALMEGKDYKVSYTNNKAIANKEAEKAPAMTITGCGNYTGKFDVKFDIVECSVTKVNSSVVFTDPVFNAKAADGYEYKPSVKFYVGGTMLVANKDYKVSYVNNKQSDIKTMKNLIKNGEGVDEDLLPKIVIQMIDGSGYTSAGALEYTFNVYDTKLTAANTKVVVEPAVYSGEVVTPSITVYYSADKAVMNKAKNIHDVAELDKLEGLKKLDASEYRVSYSSKSVQTGKNKGALTVIGCSSNYGGSVSVKFDITAKGIK